MHIKSYLNRFLSLLIFLFIISFLSSCSNSNLVSDKRILMSTTVEIKVLGENKKRLKNVIFHAFKEIERINDLMNFYDENSALSKLNRDAKDKKVYVNEDLYYVVDKCIEFGKMTDGAFDVTATSLDKYNGFKDVILNRDEQSIYFKDPGAKIDLSASAKGYAVDKAILSLRKDGVENALVNAGGDIRVIGKCYKKPWSIGIRNPKANNKTIFAIELTDEAVATSGNYLRSHIIDTLKEDEKNYRMLSSTVIANDCLTADILATSLFVLGKEGINLIESMEEVEALLITEENGTLELIETSGFFRYKIKQKKNN